MYNAVSKMSGKNDEIVANIPFCQFADLETYWQVLCCEEIVASQTTCVERNNI
jgi:hypothetical protein